VPHSSGNGDLKVKIFFYSEERKKLCDRKKRTSNSIPRANYEWGKGKSTKALYAGRENHFETGRSINKTNVSRINACRWVYFPKMKGEDRMRREKTLSINRWRAAQGWGMGRGSKRRAADEEKGEGTA